MKVLRAAAKAFSAAVRPPPPLLPSEWARENIIVTKGPKPGLWSPDDGYEFQIGILDGLFGPFEPGEILREGVVFKGAKAGITLIMMIGILYWFSFRRISAGLVVPRKPDSNDKSQELSQMIRESKSLRAFCSNSKGRTKQGKGGAELIIRSAETERDLIDWGAGVVANDEIDRSGGGNFDVAAMIDERMGSYLNRILVQLSTPTFPDFGIHKEWQLSDQRQFFMTCVFCSHKQVMKMLDGDRNDLNILWDQDAKTDDAKRASARFACQKCRKTWNRRARQVMNKSAEWVPAFRDIRKKGFAVSRMLVPSSSAEEFVKAYNAGQKDELKKKELYNQKLGLPYLSSVGELGGGAILRLITSEVQWEKPPHGFNRLFAGVDVQGGQTPFEYVYEIRAYNDENHAAVIAYGIVQGKKELAEVLDATYNGQDIQRALIDRSDGHHVTDVDELVLEIPCLEPAKFDWKATVPFAPIKKYKKSSLATAGWAVNKDDALDWNLSRFFEQEGRSPRISIARNPRSGREKELVSHYKAIRRVKDPARKTNPYTYEKKSVFGCDYPFAGALAEVARRVSGDYRPGNYRVGRVKEIAADARKERAEKAKRSPGSVSTSSPIIVIRRKGRTRF